MGFLGAKVARTRDCGRGYGKRRTVHRVSLAMFLIFCKPLLLAS
jgi:hypothetical protein